jgi:hypothetical protein
LLQSRSIHQPSAVQCHSQNSKFSNPDEVPNDSKCTRARFCVMCSRSASNRAKALQLSLVLFSVILLSFRNPTTRSNVHPQKVREAIISTDDGNSIR